MKKFISILMVLAVILSLGITAAAEENSNNGTITITNATLDQTYKVYKIFDAAPTADGEGIAYKIDPIKEEALFKALFGENGDVENSYFSYKPISYTVSKNSTANDAEVISYLTKLVLGDETKEGIKVSVVREETAKGANVVFSNLPYGYYLIESSLGAVVTLDSTTSMVEVIDKNQKPGVIDKQVVTGSLDAVIKDIEEKTNLYTFANSNTANIGDLITYKVSFTATNYDGDQAIKYYQINDIKGEGIWVEFDSFKVFVDGVPLEKGYYLPVGNANNTDNWQWLGNWDGVAPEDKTRDNADWYLVHLGYDQFRITIPWMKGQTIEGEETPGNGGPYKLEFNSEDPKFDPRVTVEVFYEAAIEPNATIGKSDEETNLRNTVRLSWITPHDVLSGEDDTVYTYTYGIGVIKEDSVSRENLPGAVFELLDANNNPVYVIPTKIDGVYIVDSLNCPSREISGKYMEDARELYGKKEDGGEGRLLAYLEGDLTKQKNEVVSQVNGRIIILGLDAGDYYLVETNPPSGYNGLSKPQKITVDEHASAFTIFANEDGKVADIQQAIGDYTEIEYHLSSVIVQNSRGVALPSTGGEGTFWLITIGTLMAIGFAVFLITHKKMSVYTD